MLASAILVLLALLLTGYVALPLLFPRQADPLPDERDPLVQDLEEERDALLRAIRELDARRDLPEAQRALLRARYEAKAAKVLRALDDAEARERAAPGAPVGGAPVGRRRRRAPYGALALLALAGISAATLGGFVLPRVGPNATVTSFFREELNAAQQLRDLQRAADRDPGVDTLAALADAYWQLQDIEGVEGTYERLLAEFSPGRALTALAHRRLGYLSLQRDLRQAREHLELSAAADPDHLDTLYLLGEVRFADNDLGGARQAWQRYLELADDAGTPNAPDPEAPDPDAGDPIAGDPGTAERAAGGPALVAARLELLDAVAPLAEAAADDPSAANLLALADAYWQRDESQLALSVYFQLLTQVDAGNVEALSRTGQAMFLAGRTDDAISLLARARELEAGAREATARGALEPQALLFLGNAYFSAERYREAIEVWEEYQAVAPEPGRVPDLIASARARLAGRAGAPAIADAGGGAAASGPQLYAANCATCHGAAGQGGAGPRLLGNARAADRANVRSLVRFGRGAMPGFGARLDEAQLEALVAYVVVEFGGEAQGARR